MLPAESVTRARNASTRNRVFDDKRLQFQQIPPQYMCVFVSLTSSLVIHLSSYNNKTDEKGKREHLNWCWFGYCGNEQRTNRTRHQQRCRLCILHIRSTINHQRRWFVYCACWATAKFAIARAAYRFFHRAFSLTNTTSLRLFYLDVRVIRANKSV